MHAGYAAERMCLRMFSEAINNTPAMNSQRGRGRSVNDRFSQLPPAGTQVIHCGLFACDKKRQGVPSFPLDLPRYRRHVSRPPGRWGKSGQNRDHDIPVPHTHASAKFSDQGRGRKCWGRGCDRTALQWRTLFHKIPEPQPPYLFRATMFGGEKKTAIRDRTGTFIEPRWDPN